MNRSADTEHRERRTPAIRDSRPSETRRIFFAPLTTSPAIAALRRALLAFALATIGWPTIASAVEPPDATGHAPTGRAPTAADTPETLEEIVVTATRGPRHSEELATTTSVLFGGEIEAMRVESLADALRFVPGLHVEQAGSRGGRASLYLRGLDPNHTAVLIDGIRVNDPNDSRGGGFDPTTLDVLAIERVEVVRGPLSAVHGADALAGAINVVTRRTAPDAPFELQAEGGGGRYSSGHARVRSSGGLGWAGISVAASYATNEAPDDGGDFEAMNWKATLDATPHRRVALRANLRLSDSNAQSFPDFSGGSTLAVIRELEQRDVLEIASGLEAEIEAAPRMDIVARLAHVHRDSDVDSPGVAPVDGIPATTVPPNSADDELDRTTFTTLALTRPLDALDVTLGADVYHEAGRSDAELTGIGPAGYSLERTVPGAFIETLYRPLVGFALSAGLRMDAPEDHPTEWSPAVGATLALPGLPIALYGNWGEGFKLPSFYALGNAIVGNPDLESERSDGWEVGVRSRSTSESVSGRIGYFDTTVRDLIDFDGATFQLVNRDTVRSRGVETEASAELARFITVSGALTFNDTDIRDTDDRLRNRPRWCGHLRIDTRPRDDLEVGVRATFVGDFYDSSNPTGLSAQKVDGYQRVDITASWRVREDVKLFATVENLFDQDYQETLGFPATGIFPRAGVEVRL